MTTTTGLTFRPLTIPASIDAGDAADFCTMVEVRNRLYRDLSGHDDHAVTPAELLPHYEPDDYETRLLWAVMVDDECIGRVGVDLPHQESTHIGFALIEILREHWGRGIGTRAHELVELFAREHGRTVLQSWASHPAAPGEVHSPPTGFGSIPLDHAARFYLAHGYRLEQVERNSILDMTASTAHIERLLADAQRAASAYRIVQWTAPTPPEHVDGYAWMKSRMSTDTPVGALEFDEEKWDAERIAVHDGRWAKAGTTALVTAAQHVATGRLCAFNELTIGPDPTVASHQEDTLVLKEHRGHRLGMLVKCAGLLRWREIAPQSPRVMTYNAEENRPMLDINEAIGFTAIAYEGAWKKVLT